jgi:hypothetical protein
MMTVKAKVLAMIRRLGDDVTCDELIEKLEVMRKIEQATWQADHGMGIDDADFWAQLEAGDGADQAQVAANGSSRPARHPQVHRGPGVARKRPKTRAKGTSRGKSS